MAAKVQYKSDILSKFFDFLNFYIGTSEQTGTIVGEKEWSVLFKSNSSVNPVIVV